MVDGAVRWTPAKARAWTDQERRFQGRFAAAAISTVRFACTPVIGAERSAEMSSEVNQRSQPSNSSRKAGQKKNAHSLPSSKKFTMIPLFQSIVTSPSILGPHACHLVRMAPRAIVASIGSHLGNALTSTFFFGRTVSGDRFRLVINTLMR